MSALLRSAKFHRLFSGIARNYSAGSYRNDCESFVGVHRQVWHWLNTRSLSSQPEPSVAANNDSHSDSGQKIENVFQRLDLDARRYGRIHRSNVDEILTEVKNTALISSSQGLMLLRCCGSLIAEELPSERTKLLDNIWDLLKSVGVKLDVSHYNARLRVYIENEHDFSPTNFLANMYSHEIVPNRVTYQRLIYRYCLLGDIGGATEILNHMKNNEIAINEDVFNSLILGHARARDLESARSMLSVMRQTSLEPSPETYRQLACAHVACGDLEGVQSVLQMARDAYTPLTPRDLLELVYSMAQAGHQESAFKVLDELSVLPVHNHDCNVVLPRLIYGGHYDLAYRVLHMTTVANKEYLNKGFTNFFTRHLILKNASPDLIVEYCQRLKNDYGNDDALSMALYRSLHEPISMPLVHRLLKALQEESTPIRQHYFWPLIVRARNNGSYEDLLQVVRLMGDFNVFLSADTMTDQIFPTVEHLGVSDSKLLYDLNSLGVTYNHSVHSLCRYYLLKHRVSDTVKIAKRFHNAKMGHTLLVGPIAKAYAATGDLSTIYLVHRMCLSALNTTDNAEKKEGDESSDVSGPQVMSLFVMTLLRELDPEQVPKLMIPMLESMLHRGLRIDASCAAGVQDHLSRYSISCPEQLSPLLEKLSDESLSPQLLDKQLVTESNSSRETLTALESQVKKARSEGSDITESLTDLFLKLLDVGELDQASAVKTELESLPAPLSFHVLDCWCRRNLSAGRLDETMAAFHKLIDSYPDQLCDMLTMRLARLMLSRGRSDDAIKLLSDQPRDWRSTDLRRNDDDYMRCCWQLVNSAAEAGHADTVSRLISLLVDCGYVPVQRRALLSLLVKAHIVSENYEEAVSAFEKMSAEYNLVPGRAHLMKCFIENNRSDLLQRVINTSNLISGEMDTLYELAISFIECGRVRQAQTVMQTPGFRPQERRLYSVCQSMASTGRLEQLGHLVEATRDVYGLDRRRLYDLLLHGHCDSGSKFSADAALAVWTQMQEEGVVPSDEMLSRLALKLQKHGVPVPFEVSTNLNAGHIQIRPHEIVKARSSTKLQPRKVVDKTVADQALHSSESDITDDLNLSVDSLSWRISRLLNQQRLTEAVTMTEQMLADNSYPIRSVLRRVVAGMSSAGMVEELRKFESKMTEEVKAMVNMTARISVARVMSGGGEKELADLETLCQQWEDGSADPRETPARFSMIVFSSLYENMPECTDRCVKLTERLSRLGLKGPMNAYWSFLMVNERYDEALKAIGDFPANQRINFGYILKMAEKGDNKQMVLKLLECLKSIEASDSVLRPVLQSLLKISTKLDTPDDTKKLFDELSTSFEIPTW